MVDEKRLDMLQDEIKLLKAEVKNSLASVRDYLLNMELPSSEFSTILAALAGDNADPQKMNVDSHVANDKPPDIPQPNLANEKPDQNLPEELGEPGEFEEMLDFEDGGKEEEDTGTAPNENMLNGQQGLPEEELPSEEESDTEEELPEETDTDEEDILPEDEIEESEEDENEELTDEEL